MHRLIIVATAATLSCWPALAADTSTDASKKMDTQATGADTSTGAKEQSSAPAGSTAETDMNPSTAGTSSDTSGGAKEQSSAPANSAAANPSQGNPQMGTKP